MIRLLFITKSENLNAYINSGKKIHPIDFLKKKNETATTTSYLCKSKEDVDNLIDSQFNQELTSIDGFIIFCDNSYYDKIKSKLGDSSLISNLGNYSNHLDGSFRVKQYLEDNITIALKVFFWLRYLFFNQNLGELLRLPVRNFSDKDLTKIRIRVSSILSNNNIENEMDSLSQALSMLKNKIRKPKKRPHSLKKFYIDENKLYFEYGKEDHSRHETDICKGHNVNCDISARFRFGLKIDEIKHFNVCKDDKENSCIEGIFDGCHGNQVTIKKTTHINMFTNDYIS